MGERILREEGFEVVTVTDGQTALLRLEDVDPDVVLADVALPRYSGYDLCREIKRRPRHKHTRVVLTSGLLNQLDDQLAQEAGSDATLKKPFEASVLMHILQPLLDGAAGDRGEVRPVPPTELIPALEPVVSTTVSADPERVRAAVILALDAALPDVTDKIIEQVLLALRR